MLEEAGADATVRDTVMGCTPRLFGICAPASWGLGFLVSQRLAEDPHLARLMDGATSALHEAARAGHAEIVRMLLQAGADPGVRDGKGQTPRESAVAAGHAGVAALL